MRAATGFKPECPATLQHLVSAWLLQSLKSQEFVALMCNDPQNLALSMEIFRQSARPACLTFGCIICCC